MTGVIEAKTYHQNVDRHWVTFTIVFDALELDWRSQAVIVRRELELPCDGDLMNANPGDEVELRLVLKEATN